MDLEAIERLIDRQRKLVKAGRPNSNCFLIMDDVMHEPKALKSPIIRQVFLNGRHWKIFTMIAAQYAMDMGPSLRANIDYCFILRETSLQIERSFGSNFLVSSLLWMRLVEQWMRVLRIMSA